MATVDELVIKFIGDAKPLFKSLDQAENKVTKFAKTAVTAIGGIFAVGAVTAFSKELLKTVDQTGKFANSVGESVEEVSKFQEITKRAGGTSEGFRSSITSLSEKLTDARINGGESALIFQRLGVSVSDTSGRVRKGTDVLLSLNKQFQALSKSEQVGFGKKLGLDEGTIKLIQKTPKELDELLKRQEKLGVITTSQAKASAELTDLFNDFSQIIRVTAMMILTTLIPIIKMITTVLIEVVAFIRKNKAFVTTFFLTLAGVILLNVIPALLLMGKTAIIAFAPFLIVGAKLALVAGIIALLVDDIMNFLKGNDSLIGSIIESLEVWYKKFIGFFGKIKGQIVKVFNDIKDNIKGFVQPIIDGLAGAFASIGSRITGFFGFGGNDKKLATQGAGASNSNTSNQVKVDNVTIMAENVKAGAVGLMEGLKDGFNKLTNNSNSGRKS